MKVFTQIKGKSRDSTLDRFPLAFLARHTEMNMRLHPLPGFTFSNCKTAEFTPPGLSRHSTGP